MSSYRHTSFFFLFLLFVLSLLMSGIHLFSIEPKFWRPDPSGIFACSIPCVFFLRASRAAGGWRKHQGGPG